MIIDTFFVLWRKYNSNISIDNLSSYIAGITRNIIKENLRKKHLSASCIDNINIDNIENLKEFSNIDTYFNERNELSNIYNNISGLNDIDIKILDMYYVQNLKIKDIANILNVKESRVKTRLHRIRNKIKKELKGSEYYE